MHPLLILACVLAGYGLLKVFPDSLVANLGAIGLIVVSINR